MQDKKINLLSMNVCEIENCDCGWNIVLGGIDKEVLHQLLASIDTVNQ